MTPDELCSSHAREQFGLITRAQALACGLSRTMITKRLSSGRWERALPSVYRIAGSPSSWNQDAMAACLWGGDNATLSHNAAARAWALTGFSTAKVEISIPAPRTTRMGFKVHRVRKELENDIVRVNGIPVTSMRWTLLDLAGQRHPRTGLALDQAIARNETSLGMMWLIYEEQWVRGRRGIAILRSLLSERTPGNAPDDSELERLMDELIRRFALPDPLRQHPIQLPGHPIRVDYCYPDANLVIETDGYAHHSDREAFTSDRIRDNELQALGWRVLRFTWAQLRFEPAKVAEMTLRHLAFPSIVQSEAG